MRIPLRTVATASLLVTFHPLALGQLAQQASDLFGGSGDDATKDLVLAPTLGFFQAGWTENPGTGRDALLIARDPNGTFRWARTWGTIHDDQIESVWLGGGGIHLCGCTQSVGPTDDDTLFLKMELDGTLAWTSSWDASPEDTVNAAVQDSSGATYLIGGLAGAAGSGRDVLLLKYAPDVAGSTSPPPIPWARAWGGSLDESANAAAIDASSGSEFLYLVGHTASSGRGGVDVLIQKFDTAGNHLWSRTWGSLRDEEAHGVHADGLGHLYVTGSTRSFSALGEDAFLLKWDVSGATPTLLWAFTWGTRGNDAGSFVTAMPSGNLVVGGETEDLLSFDREGLLLEYRPDGQLSWSMTWGHRGQDDGLGRLVPAQGALYGTGVTGRRPTITREVIGVVTRLATNTGIGDPGDLTFAVQGTESSPSGTTTAPGSTTGTNEEAVFLRLATSPPASVAYRNGGTNPQSYTNASLPVVGEPYVAALNPSSTNHTLATLVGYLGTANWTLPSGQTILVDLAHPLGDLFQLPPLPGPVAVFHLPVPPLPELFGITLSTQGVHLGGAPSFALSNAIDLTFGW